MRHLSSPRLRASLILVLTALTLGAGASLVAQIPGRNVNMVAGTDWPDGDPFLQRQNEPSIAASTRNPLHLVAGSNDYRTVDLPGLPDDVETGDAWVSIYKSFDGGQRWSSTLMPGYPQDTSAAGMASPLKGYQAAADPVVRAGTHGLVYYNGLVFNRGDNGRSGIFLARFIDQNNKENGDPIEYLGTSMVVTSDGATFLDKPWMAVDIPRGNAGFCAVGVAPDSADDDEHGRGGRVKRNGHRQRGREHDRRRGNQPPDDGNIYVPAGAVYVAYTAITGDGATLQSQIYVKRSMDCGATWSAPMRVTSTADAINQGATLAISPSTGDLFVAWRRFSPPTVITADAVMVTRLRINGSSFDAPGKAWGLRRTGPDNESERIFEHRKRRATPTAAASVAQIDQSTSPYKFRSNAYPAMAVDGIGRAYIAWSERGYAPARPSPDDGDARIRVTTTLDGRTFTAPVVADSSPTLLGHQLMPSLAFAGGKLLLVYYDLRDTRAGVFGPFVDDSLPSVDNKRQTIDIRASLGTPGATPSFAPSVRVSDYLTGYRGSSTLLEQLQVNPPNLPMFRLGTVPFIGDYIDISPSPAFVPLAGGAWGYNTAATSQFPVFHAVWTDNRDVRPPLDGNWANYSPPGLAGGSPSLFDPSKTVGVCVGGNAGSRNQNVYTARIGGGLLVGAPGNAKQLSPTVQRGFVVFAQNQTTVTKTFRMTVLAQPPGAPLSGRASFEQFPLPPYTPSSPAPKTFVDVRVPPRSTASRTVYVTSTDPKAQLSIDVSEIGAVGGPVVSGGLAGRAVLNPDIENPDIENPDIENPDIENPDIENAEVYNPDIENPDIENPDIENPDIENPDIENPDIENINVANPDIENKGVATPDIENPDIENPDIENPDIENPDIENGVISDVTWTVSNIGNTTSAFNVNMFLASATIPTGLKTQLIVYKTYKTPVLAPNGCDLKTETRNITLFNVPSPNFITPGEGLPDQNDPSDTNATLWLNPGEVGRVTLRVYDPNKNDNIIVTNLDGSTASIDPRFNPATVVTAAISGQGVDILDPPGATEPPAVTTTGTNLFYLQQPSNVAPAAVMAPPVSVRIWDNTGAPLPGVTVSLALCGPQDPEMPVVACPAPPGGVTLSGTTTAVANVDGIATFTTLSVSQAATGLTLRATATSPGAVAAGTSAPFDVTALSIPTTLTITNWARIFTGSPLGVTVTPVPAGATVAVTYNGSATVPSAIGAYTVVATPTAPYVGPSASVNETVASTLSAGGPGGGPYTRSCGPGVFATGFSANNGSTYGMLNAQLECETGGPTQRFVLDNDSPRDLFSTCGPNQVMVGFNGYQGLSDVTAGPFVKALGARCQDRSGVGPVTTIPVVGSTFQTAVGPFDCPLGEAVTGVVGGAGSVLDSVALVCGTLPVLPPTPTINSATPSTLAAFQYVTILGTSLPASGAADVLFSQGGPEYASDYTFSVGASMVIARVPTGVLANGPATVRLKNAAGTVFTNAVPVTIAGTPGAPVLLTVYNGEFGGVPTTTLNVGQAFLVEADGTGTAGTTFYWTQGPTTISQSAPFTVGGPTGRVGTSGTVPAGVTAGTWTLTVTTYTSAPSNGIVVTVVPPALFTETVITGDSSILNDGVLIAANDLGDFPDAVQVNGVPFGTDQGGLIGSWQPQDPGDFSQDGFSVTLDAVLSDLQFNNTLSPVNLTIGGLTPGASYRLQLLFSNDLNATGNRVNVTVQGATWVLDDWQPNPINLTVQFTATSPSAVVTFAPGAGSDGVSGRAVLNGYVIHQMAP